LIDYLARAMEQGDGEEPEEKAGGGQVFGPYGGTARLGSRAPRGGASPAASGGGFSRRPEGGSLLEAGPPVEKEDGPPGGADPAETEETDLSPARAPVRGDRRGEMAGAWIREESGERGEGQGSGLYGGAARLESRALRGARADGIRPYGESGERRGGERLYGALRRVNWGSGGGLEGRSVSLSLPEAAVEAPRWSAEDVDRAVERDARRYDGGFALY